MHVMSDTQRYADDAEALLEVMLILVVFVMCFFIARLYYDCQPSEEAIMEHQHNHHALKTTHVKRVVFLWAHHVLFFGLIGFGIGVKVHFVVCNWFP